MGRCGVEGASVLSQGLHSLYDPDAAATAGVRVLCSCLESQSLRPVLHTAARQQPVACSSCRACAWRRELWSPAAAHQFVQFGTSDKVQLMRQVVLPPSLEQTLSPTSPQPSCNAACRSCGACAWRRAPSSPTSPAAASPPSCPAPSTASSWASCTSCRWPRTRCRGTTA